MVCNMATLPNPDHTDMVMMLEGTFAIFVCQNGYVFETNTEGIIWCEESGSWGTYNDTCTQMSTQASEATPMVSTQMPSEGMTTPTTFDDVTPTVTPTTQVPEEMSTSTSTTMTSLESSEPLTTMTTTISVVYSSSDAAMSPTSQPSSDLTTEPPVTQMTSQVQDHTSHLPVTDTEDWSQVTGQAGNTTVVLGESSESVGSNMSYFLVGGIAGLLLLILLLSLILACRKRPRRLASSRRKQERLGQPDDQNDDAASSYNATYRSDNTFRDPPPFGTIGFVPPPATDGAVDIEAPQRRHYLPSELLPEYVTVIRIHQRDGKNQPVAPKKPRSLLGYNPSQNDTNRSPSSLRSNRESLYDSILSDRMDIPKDSFRPPGYIGHAPMADLSSGNTSLGKAWQDARAQRPRLPEQTQHDT